MTDQIRNEAEAIRRIRDRNPNMAVVKLATKIDGKDFNPDTKDFADAKITGVRPYLSIYSVIRRYDDRRLGTEKTIPKSKRRKVDFAAKSSTSHVVMEEASNRRGIFAGV